MASYLEHAGVAGLWYQLDESDADVATFFHYLRLAAADLGDERDEPLPLLAPEYHAGLPVFARRQSLYARLGTPFAIVFDGYEAVSAFSQFHDVTRDALAQLPRGGCVILVSRGDPPAGLARLRANRAIANVGREDLRLTREETDSIVRQRRPQVQPGTLEELHAKTRGWAAGLILLLEQSRRLGSITEPPEARDRHPWSATGRPRAGPGSRRGRRGWAMKRPTTGFARSLRPIGPEWRSRPPARWTPSSVSSTTSLRSSAGSRFSTRRSAAAWAIRRRRSRRASHAAWCSRSPCASLNGGTSSGGWSARSSVRAKYSSPT
ncbi:MAG: hypothetical protein Fur0039_18310 [Rhodocyclaceae bacterium]